MAGGCGRLFHLTCCGLLFINVWDTAQRSNKQHYPYLVPSHLRLEETATESTAPKWLCVCSAASVIFFLKLVNTGTLCVSLRGVCLCMFHRGTCGVIWLSKTGSSEMPIRWSFRGWPVKSLLAPLTFTNTTSCTGTTSEPQPGELTAPNRHCLDENMSLYAHINDFITFRCPFYFDFK